MSVEMKKNSASDPMIKSSMQKVNLVADLIRGRNAMAALLQLDYCKKSVAVPIRKVLNSALATLPATNLT